jgi:hypothetical protein
LEKPKKAALVAIAQESRKWLYLTPVILNGDELNEDLPALMDEDSDEEPKTRKSKKIKVVENSLQQGSYLTRKDFSPKGVFLSMNAEWVPAISLLFKNPNWLLFAQEVVDFMGYDHYNYFC